MENWTLSEKSFPCEDTDKGTSLVVQWLRLLTSNAGDTGLIPGQGTRSQMLQLRVCIKVELVVKNLPASVGDV